MLEVLLEAESTQACQMENVFLPNNVNKIFLSQRNTKMPTKFFNIIFHMKRYLLLNDRKSQFSCVKAFKYRVVEMAFSSNR